MAKDLTDQYIENEKTYKIKKFISNFILYTFLSLIAIAILIPFYWMLMTSLKTEIQISQTPPIIFLKISEWRIENYNFGTINIGSHIQPLFPFWTYLKNTVIVALVTTSGMIITTVLSAFAFARLNFKGRDTVFALLLATMMVPGEIFILTNFITIFKFGWYDIFGDNQTYLKSTLALTVPFMVSVFYIFYLRQMFKQIPNELYYAAKVDGTSDFKYLTKVMIPMALPTIVTIIILSSMGAWSAYIWPALVTTSDKYRLVSNGLRSSFTNTSTGRTDYGKQMAAATLVTLPLLIVFFTFKKQIMRGVSRSGIKG